jgi:hypothetical protein
MLNLSKVILFALLVVVSTGLPVTADYQAEVVVGFGIHGETSVGYGPEAAYESSKYAIVHPDGRYVYLLGMGDNGQIKRYDTLTKMVEAFAGLPTTGYRDGPAHASLFSTDMYAHGGLGFSPDGNKLYFIDQYGSGEVIRVIDIATREASTLAKGVLGSSSGGASIIAMCVGEETGNIYVANSGGGYWQVTPDGEVTVMPALVPVNGEAPNFINYIAVDEPRQKIYNLNRRGYLSEWNIGGGAGTLMNPVGVSRPTWDQYRSDGTVDSMATFGPVCLGFHKGYLYFGGGDGKSFRRIDPVARQVLSTCKGDSLNQIYWGKGNGSNSLTFMTWCQYLTFDKLGNAYHHYSINPRLVRLRKLN